MLFMSSVCHAFTALWSPAGKGLTSWLLFVMFNFVFVSFPSGSGLITDSIDYLPLL